MRAVAGLVGGAYLTPLYGLSGIGIAWIGAQGVATLMVALLMLFKMKGSSFAGTCRGG